MWRGECLDPKTDQPDLVRDLAFQAPDGGATSIAAFAGKAVLVNLWATWCVPCRAEMPALDRLEGAFGSDRFQVVTVNVDQAQSGTRPRLP